MKSKSLLLFYAGLLFSFALPANAGSPVWRIEHNGAVMFIAGTIHLLADSDYPLPTAYEMAYQQAATLVFETDIDAMLSPQISQKIMQQAGYRDGRQLRDDLSPEVYAAAEQFFTQRGVPMSRVTGYKPGMVSIMMNLVELQRFGQAGIGVDKYLNQRAKQDSKNRDHLESVDKQIDFITSLGAGQEDELIEYTLKDLAQLPQFLETVKTAWRDGDLDSLDRIGNDPVREAFPQIYRDLIIDRNHAWLARLDKMLLTEEVELVLVGALHLAGSDGLIEHYRRRGYRVTQLQ